MRSHKKIPRLDKFIANESMLTGLASRPIQVPIFMEIPLPRMGLHYYNKGATEFDSTVIHLMCRCTNKADQKHEQ